MGAGEGMRRRIIAWEKHQPPPEYIATLECGHTKPEEYYEYGDGMTTESMVSVDAIGSMFCSSCCELDEAIKKTELQLKALRAIKSRTP